VLFCRDGSEPAASVFEANHNVYRLAAAGAVVWQVRRDDSIYGRDAWWEGKHQRARARGEDGAREPFTYIWLEYTDGRPARYSDEDGDGVGIALWEPGCIIRMKSGYGGALHYVLNPETGIAKQIAMPPQRPW
jgi:hypothetical protein